jgi:hypothetical protein
VNRFIRRYHSSLVELGEISCFDMFAVLVAHFVISRTYSRALLPPGEGGPKGRMRDPHNFKIPHPPLRGTLSRWERDARIRT